MNLNDLPWKTVSSWKELDNESVAYDEGSAATYFLEELDPATLRDDIFAGSELREDSKQESKKSRKPQKKRRKSQDNVTGTHDSTNDRLELQKGSESKRARERKKKNESNESKKTSSSKASDEQQKAISLSASTGDVEKSGRPNTKKKRKRESLQLAQLPDEEAAALDMSDWGAFELHDYLISGLRKLSFVSPTEIQRRCLPEALRKGKDVVGAAETGSGKTLAFGLPTLQSILKYYEKHGRPADLSSRFLFALILTPTRELALQVSDHLCSVSSACSPAIQIVPLVGGISVAKQRRLVKKRPEIIVGTPGRLWDLMQERESNEIGKYLCELDQLRCLVIDEADRMLEFGQFAELSNIFAMLSDQFESSCRQTFVFSATLSDAVSDAVSSSVQHQRHGRSISSLLEQVRFNRKKVVIDLTSERFTASKLLEKKIECRDEEKEAYLYGILKAHSGRTLVFVNAINCIRRLVSVFQLLNVPVRGLHAQLQQKQRLKNLEAFYAAENGVLIATDVAARGLDIPNVQNVVHYEVPRTMELYIHRSGRTARADKTGLSVALVSPKEGPRFAKILRMLGRDSMSAMKISPEVMFDISEQVKVAKQLELERYRGQKKFGKRSAKSEIEQEFLSSESEDSEERRQFHADRLRNSQKLKSLRADLTAKLHKPVGYTKKGKRSLVVIDPANLGALTEEAKRIAARKKKGLSVESGASTSKKRLSKRERLGAMLRKGQQKKKKQKARKR